MKFGGTSISDGDRIRHVANLVRRHTQNKMVVVVSALSGVTDGLIDAAERAKKADRKFVPDFVGRLSKTHQEAARTAIVDPTILHQTSGEIDEQLSELERVLTGVAYLTELTPRSLDYVLSFGERLSAPILRGALQSLGVKSESLTGGEAGLVTDDRYGEARPLMAITRRRTRRILGPHVEDGVVPVVTGYIASTRDGVTTTLGRGGSDYTAAILGEVLDADEVWIWSDVDGLMTADPKMEPSARTLPVLSFSEAMEMAYFGAKVVHPKALEVTMEKGIPVRVKNTFNPEGPETLITSGRLIKCHDVVKAVTLIKDVALVTVGGAGMMGTPGMAAKIFGILGQNDVNVLMISQGSSEANISFVIPRKDHERAVSVLRMNLLGEEVKRISSENDICVIAAVGAGMKGTPGVAARVFRAVADQGVNIRMISQGSSELNISFVVQEIEGAKVISALHREFQLDRLDKPQRTLV